MIGKTISHYKILEKIGSGGMGVVYKAEDTKLKRTVALKFLPPEFSRDKEAKKRFLYEAQAAAAIEHPNICPVYEINEDDDRVFIAMSYMDGQTLMDRINQGPLENEESLKIVTQIAEGLLEAHEHNIVHRDIKPANIFITKKNVAKILDFGLAKLRGQTKLTKESTTLGTIAYMSPEQTTGEEVDQRTDIWSLGVVLYEMLTGKLPFRGHYEQAIMYSIMNEDPEPIKELLPDIPIQLEKIINKMLAKDPSQRYPNLSDFIEDLKRFKKGKELKEITIEPKYKIRLTPKSLALGIFFLVVIIIVTGYFIFNGKPGPKAPTIKPLEKISLAIMYFENNSGDEGLDYWRSALAELIITDLSQSRYIRVLQGHRIFSIFKKLKLLESKKYSSDDLKAVANQGRVNHILKGSYIKAGENFVITSMLQNMSTGEIISSLKVQARGAENIFPKVDELTRKIKLKFNLTRNQIDSDIDKDVADITTTSPEAYKFYIEARKNHFLGHYGQSIPIYEKAVAIDPEFALAYVDMGSAYFWLSYQLKAKEYYQKAMDLSDRVSERERYYIQGLFYSASEKYGRAIEAYTKLLELYPDDNDGNNNLGVVYTLIEEWDKAIEPFISCIQRKDEVIWPYLNLSIVYRAKGLYDKAKEILEYYLNNVSDNAELHNQLAVTYLFQKKYDLALVEVDKASSIDPENYFYSLTKGIIYFCKGDLIRAEKKFQKIFESEEIKAAHLIASQNLGALYLSQGRFEKSEEQLKQGILLAKELVEKKWESSLQLDYTYRYLKSGRFKEALKASQNAQQTAVQGDSLFLQISSLHSKGIAYLEMKSMEKAQRAAAKLKELIESGINKKVIRYYHHLMGKIELKRENFSKAVEFFKRGISLLQYQCGFAFEQWFVPDSHALFIEPLALAYYKMSDLDKAQQEYEKITSLSNGRIYYGDIYARSFYLLGKIYQEKGWKGKAIENYNKFIELWKNCDPIFQAMVEDARKRVKELEGSSE